MVHAKRAREWTLDTNASQPWARGARASPAVPECCHRGINATYATTVCGRLYITSVREHSALCDHE
eukprot:350363-Chlamydomonas_euryale.AAC.3